jgi:hypothetical protein
MSKVSEVWGIRHLVRAFKFTRHSVGRAWDRISLQSLLSVLVISLILSLGVQAYNTSQVSQQTSELSSLGQSNRRLADANRKTLGVIEGQTSPEAIAQQKAQVEDIIGIIDCNQRQALQDALQGLVERDILNPEDVVTITRACAEQRESTATTTTIPR